MNEEQDNILKRVYQRCGTTFDPNITLIEGPPGTGKSRLIANLVMQFLYGREIKKPKKILICAHSNAAVDVIAEKLLKIQNKMRPSSRKYCYVYNGCSVQHHRIPTVQF